MNNSPKQLSFFDNSIDAATDNRPLPLIVAERWGFSLQYCDTNDGLRFSVIDWIAGIGSNDPFAAKRHYDNISKNINILKMVTRYVMQHTGNVEQSVFTDDRGLYRIAQDMRVTKNRPALDVIKKYLADSGAFADWERRNPEAAAQLHESRAARKRQAEIGKYERANLGKHPAVEHLRARDESIRVFWALHDTIKDVCSNPNYGQITNTEYVALFNETTSQLKAILNTTSIRNELPSTQLLMLTASERMLRDYLAMHQDITNDDVLEGIAIIIAPMGAHLRKVCDLLGVHPITNTKLLVERVQ